MILERKKMTDIQNRLLLLLDFFHNFCKENSLKYYAAGGTALGAMRHAGFIAWDDDLDVVMPRADYEKLRQLRKEKDTEEFVFEFPGEKKDFVYTYAKMYDTSTTLIENTRYKTKRGFYIDIFPLDGVGNTYEEAVDRFHSFIWKDNLIATTVCAWRKGRKLYKNLAIMAAHCIPRSILSSENLIKKFEVACQKLSFDECTYVAVYGAAALYHEKVISKKAWYGQPVEYKFEDQMIYMPEMPDEYLTGLFGDWRKLPPKEEQVSNHDFIFCDLDHSYKD